MSTILGFQIFSPIGFENYPCKFTNLCRECESCDVSQNAGYFDHENTDVISFYSRDYVNGKKKMNHTISLFNTSINYVLIDFFIFSPKISSKTHSNRSQ